MASNDVAYMNSPLVSVVMVTCNVEHFLAEAIESILGQTFKDFEFIIVDFGSVDRSKAIAQSYAIGDARIRLHEIRNCGLADARNASCLLARGRYIAIMDADDVSLPDRLSREIDFMNAHPEVGVLGGDTEWIDAAGKSFRVERFPTDDRAIRAVLPAGCAFCQPTVLIRKEAFDLVGGYRKAFVFAEDCDLWLRMAEHFQLANLGQVVLKYRSHPHQVQLRKARQQSLCILAAQASASSRKNGNADPLASVEEITPAVLVAMGVSEATQRINADRDVIRALNLAGDYSNSLKTAMEALQSPDWEFAESWQLAETWLIVARHYWKQGRFARSFFAAGRAFITRPVIAGRPLKPFLRWVRFPTEASGR
ncbi:MAG: glycosyltransferase [Candidatus Acidiferrales bacterium]